MWIFYVIFTILSTLPILSTIAPPPRCFLPTRLTICCYGACSQLECLDDFRKRCSDLDILRKASDVEKKRLGELVKLLTSRLSLLEQRARYDSIPWNMQYSTSTNIVHRSQITTRSVKTCFVFQAALRHYQGWAGSGFSCRILMDIRLFLAGYPVQPQPRCNHSIRLL